MEVQLENIVENPFRDLDKNPILTTKVESLKASVKKTDFWDNIMCRPKDNTYNEMVGEDLINYLKDLTEAPVDMVLELAYGHHRLAALDSLEWTTINIPVKSIDDEKMLHIMAEENKADYGANMNVLLETVRQVRVTLHDQAAKFEEFEEYVEKHDFFRSKKDWRAAKDDIGNIGFRRVHSFLGETWSENDIRTASSVLSAIEEGLYEQEQIVDMPSVNVLKGFTSLTKAIRVNEVFPEYFKEKYVTECSSIICDPKAGTTVKILSKAATMTKKANIPTDYLTKQKVTAFDLTKQLKAIVVGSPEDNPITPVDFLEMEGLAGTEGLEEAIEAVEESIKKDSERRERAGGADVPEPETEEAGEAEDAQAAIATAEAEAAEMVDPGLPEIEEGVTDINQLAAVFVDSTAIYVSQANRLKGGLDDMDKKVFDNWGSAFEDAFKTLVILGLESYGKPDLLSMMEEAEASI